MSEFSGAYAILYTFFDADGRLDRKAMRRQVEASPAAGAHGVAALGRATEISKLSRDERWAIMDWVTEDVGGRAPMAFTVFGATPDEQIKEARRAGSVCGFACRRPGSRRENQLLPNHDVKEIIGAERWASNGEM